MLRAWLSVPLDVDRCRFQSAPRIPPDRAKNCYIPFVSLLLVLAPSLPSLMCLSPTASLVVGLVVCALFRCDRRGAED